VAGLKQNRVLNYRMTLGPVDSRTRRGGRPPMPSAISSAIEPVGINRHRNVRALAEAHHRALRPKRWVDLGEASPSALSRSGVALTTLAPPRDLHRCR